MHEELKELIVPVLTPFKVSGEIDQRAFIRHLEFLAHHIENSIQARSGSDLCFPNQSYKNVV